MSAQEDNVPNLSADIMAAIQDAGNKISKIMLGARVLMQCVPSAPYASRNYDKADEHWANFMDLKREIDGLEKFFSHFSEEAYVKYIVWKEYEHGGPVTHGTICSQAAPLLTSKQVLGAVYALVASGELLCERSGNENDNRRYTLGEVVS